MIVRGPQVSPEYIIGNEHNAKAKISDGDTIWHRMGDVGYFDDEQRFWYCGRKTHRIRAAEQTFFTLPVEAVFNTHSKVMRSALVGVLNKHLVTPVLVVEPVPLSEMNHQEIRQELLELGSQQAHTSPIHIILFHPALPVDVRHNSKINREALALWASKQLNTPPNP